MNTGTPRRRGYPSERPVLRGGACDARGYVALARTHGIRATYVDGCRCGPCTDAERDYWHKRRERMRAL